MARRLEWYRMAGSVMKRLVINVALGFSVVLLAAAVALWVRSYLVQDTITVRRRNPAPARFYMSDHRLFSVRGQLLWKVSVYAQPPEFAESERRARERSGLKDFDYRTARSDEFYFNPAGPGDPLLVRLGFRNAESIHTRTTPFIMSTRFREVGIPHWVVVALAGALPAAFAWGKRRRRLRNRSAGSCPECGYDLRGITGRCPECGTEIHGAEAAPTATAERA